MFGLSPAQPLLQPQAGRDDFWRCSVHPTLKAFPGSSSLQVVGVPAMEPAGLYVNLEEGGQEGHDKLRELEESTECSRISYKGCRVTPRDLKKPRVPQVRAQPHLRVYHEAHTGHRVACWTFLPVKADLRAAGGVPSQAETSIHPPRALYLCPQG